MKQATQKLAAFGVVTSVEELQWFLDNKNPESKVVVDTEFGGPNKRDPKLVGVSVAFRGTEGNAFAFYVPFIKWDSQLSIFEPAAPTAVITRVLEFINSQPSLIAHNAEADRVWLDKDYEKDWYDTRKMWHLSDDKDSPHGFGLKTAQTELLGWSETNEKELNNEVRSAGGLLSNGDHYLANYGTLGSYAILDALSTLLTFECLRGYFDRHLYWDFLLWRTRYHGVLTEATTEGIIVDVDLLLEGREHLVLKLEQAEREIRETCKEEIQAIEENWFKEKVNGYKMEHARERFIKNPSQHRRFNPKSAQQRELLFFNKLGFTSKEKTKGGRAKTDRSTLSNINHPGSAAFVRFSEAEAVLRLVEGYIDSLVEHPDGTMRLHCPYNNCGTVSDRLGGYKPYALNMPFNEKVMEAFKVPKGYIGVHSDVSSLEPCLTAAFSKDPTLLKVNRDGLGDVYLDLALDVFPDHTELHAEYDPWVPVKAEVKKKFKKERDVCKIVFLAKSYTGTTSTIFKNLIKSGFNITKAFARTLDQSYHIKFRAVDNLAGKLKALHSRDGHIRNVAGRILCIPEKFSKDTLNRFIQSGGHDLVVEWVLEISKMSKERPELGLKPLLPDVHDSTSWIVKQEYAEDAKFIFEEAMRRVNTKANLGVTLKADVKFFTTLAGLKD